MFASGSGVLSKMNYVVIVIALGKFGNFFLIQIYRNVWATIIVGICVVHYLRRRRQNIALLILFAPVG